MADTIPKSYRWVQKSLADLAADYSHILESRDDLINLYVKRMLSITNVLFEYEGLPDTLPAEELEKMIQSAGYVVITKVKPTNNSTTEKELAEGLYGFVGGLGGVQNAYYEPTWCTIANPGTGFNGTVYLGKDAVIIRNDIMMEGMLPSMYVHATQMADADISIDITTINTRVASILSADDDQTKEDLDKFMSLVRAGAAGIGVVGTAKFGKGLAANPVNNATGSAELIKGNIEARQYALASWFISNGLNADFNMKREAVNSSETSAGENTLIPFVDLMLHERERGVKRVNDMFGTNITVRKGKAWRMAEEAMTHDDPPSSTGEHKEDSADDTPGSES